VNEFAKRLAETIKNNGVTQSALAKRMKVSQQSVSYWVKGIYEPSINQIVELCRILETTPNYLFGFTDF
jgi:transcriptional regulator with XRE-family HTH domain